MLRCAEALSGCYGHLLYTHLITITKPWVQDAISCVVYEWVFNLHGCVMQLSRCIKMAGTDWSSCFISALLCLLLNTQISNTLIMILVTSATSQSEEITYSKSDPFVIVM